MYLELQTKKYGIVKYQISKQDLELVRGLTLYVSYVKQTDSMYLITKDRKYLHRIIMKAQRGEIIDHINHDTLNNTRENLRVVTHAENIRNSLKSYQDKQKLSQKEIKEILESKESNNTLAKKYKVSNCLIAKIRTGEMYKEYCPEIKRKKRIPRNPSIELEKKRVIKETVINYQGSLYKLSKVIGIASNKLYQIRNGKIWKNI